MTRTMIDIFRKGNQELFHSSMICWLLDPDAEHGLGKQFLELFAEKLAYTRPELKAAVEASELESVQTEVTSSESRYDIDLQFESTRIVIENKTKSVGDVPQLDKYQADDTYLVALGFCEASFAEGLPYPLIYYRDILDILQNVSCSTDKFGLLVEDYREFLDRELMVLREIVERYDDLNGNGLEAWSAIDNDVYAENDRRFFNLFFLEMFRRRRLSSDSKQWRGTEWHSNKNDRSGVWLAMKELPETYTFSEPIQKLCRNYGAKLWFHLQLEDGALTRASGIGEIQLRCEPEGDNKQFFQEFLETDQGSVFKPPNKPKSTAKTFYLVRRNLTEHELGFDNLARVLTEFCEDFGSFAY